MGHRNPCVDQMRFLAACSVVCNHGLFAHQLPLMVLAGRWTVPFFFMLSGYFYHQRSAQSPGSSFGQLAKPLLALLAVANGVYLVFVRVTSGSLTSLATHFTWLVGTYFHLWFLTALLMATLLLWGLLRHQLGVLLPYLAVISLGCSLSLDAYHQPLGAAAHPLYARSLLAFPCVSMGFGLAKFELSRKLPRWLGYGLIPLGLGLAVLEANWLLSNQRDWPQLTCLGGTLLLAVGMVLVGLQGAAPTGGLMKRISAYGRRYAVALYVYHPLVYYGLQQALASWPAPELWYWLSPLLTLLLLLGLLMAVNRQSPRLFGLLIGQWRRPSRP